MSDARPLELRLQLLIENWRSWALKRCQTGHFQDVAAGQAVRGCAERVEEILATHVPAPATAHRACPCLHTTPCHERCTCVNPLSSRGCRRCCSYGSPEQQRAMAEYLVAQVAEGERCIVELHRCVSCGLRWEGPSPRAEYCGDCHRAALAAKTKEGDARPQPDDLSLLFAENGALPAPTRVAAFLRLYAKRIRQNERWDIPETMAKAYESAARSLDDYMAALAAAGRAAPPTPEWQPIETAPEATRVWVYVPNLGCIIALKTTHPSDGSVWWDGEEQVYRPSHWMPLPAPPALALGPEEAK